MQSAIASIIQSTDSIGEEELIIIFIARLKLKGKYLGERYPASLSSHRWGVSQDGGWGGGGRILSIIAYMGRLCPKGIPFTSFRYMKGWGFH